MPRPDQSGNPRYPTATLDSLASHFTPENQLDRFTGMKDEVVELLYTCTRPSLIHRDMVYMLKDSNLILDIPSFLFFSNQLNCFGKSVILEIFLHN